jgi:hypothetical protein
LASFENVVVSLLVTISLSISPQVEDLKDKVFLENSPVLRFDHSVHLLNCRFERTSSLGPAHRPAYAVTIVGANSFIIDNCSFMDFQAGTLAILADSVSVVNITECRFERFRSHGADSYVFEMKAAAVNWSNIHGKDNIGVGLISIRGLVVPVIFHGMTLTNCPVEMQLILTPDLEVLFIDSLFANSTLEYKHHLNKCYYRNCVFSDGGNTNAIGIRIDNTDNSFLNLCQFNGLSHALLSNNHNLQNVEAYYAKFSECGVGISGVFEKLYIRGCCFHNLSNSAIWSDSSNSSRSMALLDISNCYFQPWSRAREPSVHVKFADVRGLQHNLFVLHVE